MKFYKKLAIIALLATTAIITAVFGACNVSVEEQKKEEGFIHTVTYNANGGNFTETTNTTYTLVQDNSLTAVPGFVDKNRVEIKVPYRTGYQLVGENKENVYLSQSWYVAETDANGNIVYEGEGEARTAKLASTTPWNFLTDKVTKDITLVAVWQKVYKFVICYYDGETEEEFSSYIVNPGDTIIDKLYAFDNGEFVRRPDYIRYFKNGYTPINFYTDKELTQEVAEDFAHPGKVVVDGQEINDVKIYVDALKGRYEFITQDNVKTLNSNANWYLLEDIDLTEKEWTGLSNFNGNIYGNGYTISNLKVSSTAKKPSGNYNKYSIFGTIKGVIKDLTFKNVSYTLNGSEFASILGEQRVSFFGYEIDDGTVENVVLEDCSFNINFSDSIVEVYNEDAGYIWYNAPQNQNISIVNNGAPATGIVPTIQN